MTTTATTHSVPRPADARETDVRQRQIEPRKFFFDPSLTASENFERFLQHMAGIDPEMTGILRAHLGAILPFPSDASARGRARVDFNKAVIEALASLPEATK